MTTFQLNFRIPDTERDQLINALGLEMICEYTERNTYLKDNATQREYVQNINEEIKYCSNAYDNITGLWQITAIPVEPGSTLEKKISFRKKLANVRCTVEQYRWLGMNAIVEFLAVNFRKNFFTVRISTEDETNILSAKNFLNQIGYTQKLLPEDEKERVTRKSLWKDPLFYTILGVAGAIVLLFIIQSKSITQPSSLDSEKVFVFMQKQLTNAPLCSQEGECLFFHSLGKCGPNNENWIRLDAEFSLDSSLDETQTFNNDALEHGSCVCYRQRCVLQPSDEMYIEEFETTLFAP
ncbi:MAG: hypothetical protein PHY34_01565 [Patescibacteria group bacterium]|nr:hypothetical protein [Patescibacteria group bacterium]MDD5715091.1 hypothetical protein [Patescibacteria group bacterium]